jgi:ribose-phosphate pyrophosphokinase
VEIGPIRLFTGNANKELAERIATHIGQPLNRARVKRFSDGEIWVEILENARGSDAFIIQPVCAPANDHLMELLIMIDALKRASADRITAVTPYYGYARQDRKVEGRTPISAKLIADLLQKAGADRVLAIDLHAGQIQGFFNIPVDHLYASIVFRDYLLNKMGPEQIRENIVIVSPDAGGVARVQQFADYFGSAIAIIYKKRPGPNEVKVIKVAGLVKGKKAMIFDDIIDTAGTLVSAADYLMSKGATEVSAYATHPVLSGPAIERLNNSVIEKLYVSDTIPLGDKLKQCPKIEVISIAKMVATAIQNIHHRTSVSTLFD